MTDDNAMLVEQIRQLAAPEDESSRRIIDAARTCFAASGIRQTTMNRIAAEAGLGVATVYRRFPQKEQLVQAVLMSEAARFIADVDGKIAGASSPEEQMTQGFTAFVTGISSRPLLINAMRGDSEAGLPLLTQHGEPVLALGRGFIAGTIRHWQDEGAIADFDADLVAEIFARLALSLVLTPDGLIPTGDDEVTRAFARKHLLPLLTPYAG